MRTLIITSLIIFSAFSVKAQSSVKTGWTFGVLPSVAYDADLGFQYGALTNIYYHGDGSHYPEYLHSIYAEASYTTKHNGLIRLNFDSRAVLPGYRLSLDISYIPDEMSDFAGFNGYQAVYNDDWRNDESSDYLSRAFYKYRRNMFRAAADIQGSVTEKLKWNAGLGVLSFNVGSVDINKLNRGEDENNKLPDIECLYDKYRKWGLISDKEISGGSFPFVHAGATFDTRNMSAAPSKGIWADAFLTYSAAFGDKSEFNSLKLNANFRQYISLGTPKAVLAYRIGTQLTLAGSTPFYMLCYHNNLVLKRAVYESLGGSSSLRGIMRNRILSNGFLLANVEMRLRIVSFDIGTQHFYIASNPFVDAGIVVQPVDIDEDNLALATVLTGDNAANYFDFGKSNIYRPHVSGGVGLKIAMNENFILSIDWATPFNTQDSGKKSNLYIKMGYLF